MRVASLFFKGILPVSLRLSHTRKLSTLNEAGEDLVSLAGDFKKIPTPKPPANHSKFIYPLMTVLGMTIAYRWFTSEVDESLATPSPTLSIESTLLVSIRQERIRLEKNYDNSFTGNRTLAWVTGSKGYAHWKKIEALKQAEKDLDKHLGGSGKLAEETLAQLSAAYSYSPEEADVLFKEKHLDPVSSEQRLKK